jgi:hypothetical protein
MSDAKNLRAGLEELLRPEESVMRFRCVLSVDRLLVGVSLACASASGVHRSLRFCRLEQ